MPKVGDNPRPVLVKSDPLLQQEKFELLWFSDRVAGAFATHPSRSGF